MSLSGGTAAGKRRRNTYNTGADLSDQEGDLETAAAYDDGEYLDNEGLVDDEDEYYDDDEDYAEENSDYKSAAAPLPTQGRDQSLAAVGAIADVVALADQSPMLKLMRDQNVLLAGLVASIQEKDASAHATQVRAHKHQQNLQTKEVNFILTTSLAEIAKKGGAVLKLDDSKDAVFPTSKKPLVGIVVRAWKNPSAASFVLVANHLPNKACNPVISASKVVGLFHLDAKGHSNGYINEPILTDNEDEWSRAFRLSFPGETAETIGKKCDSTKVEDPHTKEITKQFIVPKDDPIAARAIDLRSLNNVPHEHLWNSGLQKYLIEEKEFTLVKQDIISKLHNKVHDVDLNKDLYFDLHRAKVDAKALQNKSLNASDKFLSPAEIIGNIKAGKGGQVANLQSELEKPFNITLKCNVTYLDDSN